jgi:hypothetical protein
MIFAIPVAVHSLEETFENGSQKLASVQRGRSSQKAIVGRNKTNRKIQPETRCIIFFCCLFCA